MIAKINEHYQLWEGRVGGGEKENKISCKNHAMEKILGLIMCMCETLTIAI